MKIPDIPSNEIARQAALERSGLLDTDAEERFDRLTRMARYAFDAPIAIVSLIDKNRQWFKSVQGLSITETPVTSHSATTPFITPTYLSLRTPSKTIASSTTR